jgi:hypothetical protein
MLAPMLVLCSGAVAAVLSNEPGLLLLLPASLLATAACCLLPAAAADAALLLQLSMVELVAMQSMVMLPDQPAASPLLEAATCSWQQCV